VLKKVKEERNIQTIKRKNPNCIGHILHKNCLLKDITEGKIDLNGVKPNERVVKCSWVKFK
jgi:hypothetical protein